MRWQQPKGEPDENSARHLADARKAMDELSRAVEEFPSKYAGYLSAFVMTATNDPREGATWIPTKIVPAIDAYLHAMDDAIAKEEIVIHESAPDPAVSSFIETVRKRANRLRTTRGKLLDLNAKLAAGETIVISSALADIAADSPDAQ